MRVRGDGGTFGVENKNETRSVTLVWSTKTRFSCSRYASEPSPPQKGPQFKAECAHSLVTKHLLSGVPDASPSYLKKKKKKQRRKEGILNCLGKRQEYKALFIPPPGCTALGKKHVERFMSQREGLSLEGGAHSGCPALRPGQAEGPGGAAGAQGRPSGLLFSLLGWRRGAREW